jgi:cell division protein FtsB
MLQIINGEMEYKASATNKAGSNAVTVHSHMKRNISGLAITFMYGAYLINSQAQQSCLLRAERKICHLLQMDDLKLLGRSEEYLENEIKHMKAISKDINMNF